MSTTIHVASTVVPVSTPPVADGAVAVQDGAILAVGPRSRVVDDHPQAEIIEWEGVILPGLVNAHTHLQYTSFEEVGATIHPDYVAWSARFVEEYERRKDDDWAASARRGVEMSIRNGTTCFSDIVTDLDALHVLTGAGVAGVSYLEVIGVDETAWEERVSQKVEEIVQPTPGTGVTSVGISPHAPYSVDEPVLKAVADLARRLGRRLHVHLAESDTEDDYYRNGRGALAERVTMRVGHAWSILGRGGTGLGAAEFADSCGLLGPDSHVAHGVYLGAEGRDLLRRRGTTVALCPRSNITVGIDPPPIREFLEEGSPIAVGTDSLGSSPSLDLIADVKLLYRLAREDGYHGEDLGDRLVHAVTKGGAVALGLDGMVGELIPGARADLAIFDVDPDVTRIGESLATRAASHCTGTVIAGDTRHRLTQ